MICRDDLPDTPEWAPDCHCGVCHTCLPALVMPDCELGEN